MPYLKLSLEEAALFLHIPKQDLRHLAKRGEIPFYTERGRTVFRKNELREWAMKTVFQERRKKIGRHHYSSQNVWSRTMGVPRLLGDHVSEECVTIGLAAKTRPSLLKELSLLAQKTYHVSDASRLHRLLHQREEEQSTGLGKGIAIPHPKVHDPTLFFQSFLVIALLPRGIPFASPDGELCDLFFMPCAESDEDHIFMISRLAALLKKTSLARDLRTAPDAVGMVECLRSHENAMVNFI